MTWMGRVSLATLAVRLSASLMQVQVANREEVQC